MESPTYNKGMSLDGGHPGHDEATLVDSLSPRERQLLEMATNGLTDQAIANELGISLATVSTYWGRIRIKYGPLGRTEIVARYLKALMTRATAELTASEARMRTVLEASPVGIFLTDPDGRAVYVNAAYTAIAGEGEGELVQEGLAALVFPGDRPGAQIRNEGMEYGSEQRWVRGDGTVAWVRLRSDAWVHDGKIAGRVGVVEDVTLEHEARARQTEAEERYHVLFSLAPEAIVSVDEDLNVVGFNASAERMFGYALAEIVGRPLDTLIPERFRRDHRGHVEAFGRGTVAAARPMAARTEVRGLRRGGEEFPCEASIVRQALGGKSHYTAIVRDVTGRLRSPAPTDALDAIPLVAWRVDEAGGFVEGNGLFHQYAGGTTVPVLPEDRTTYGDALRRAADTGRSDAKLRLHRASDGSSRWHLAYVQRADPEGWSVVCADVHDLEVAADELRRVKAVLGNHA